MKCICNLIPPRGEHSRKCEFYKADVSHDTIKQEVREEFENRFPDVNPDAMTLPTIRGHKEELHGFLDELTDRVREATIQECVEALPKDESIDWAKSDGDHWYARGYNYATRDARTRLLALKNKD